MTKLFKESVSLLLVLVLLAGFFPVLSGADECGYTPVMRVKELNDGDTDAAAGEAYSILNDDDLKALSEYCSAGRLTEGVTFYIKHDFTNSERKLSPIGTEEHPFAGIFDGCGYIIDGLALKSTGDSALFGYVSGEIRNLCVLGTAYGSNAGGIALFLTGRIVNCMSCMTVDASKICGGIAAFSQDGKIENCIFAGRCSSGGGIAGELFGTASVDNCYYTYYGANTAILSAEEDCTYDIHRFASSPSMCVCEGELSLGSYVGEDITELLNAWIGLHGSDGICYREWYFDTRTEATERIGGRYPTIVYPDYAFPEEESYTANASMTTLYEMDEDAVEGAYYSISDALELSYLAEFVNAGHSTKGATFYLTADMSIISSDSHYKGESWVPIGNSSQNSFKGIFDGQGFVITELLLNDVASADCPDYAGLFGYVNYPDAEIKNVAVNGDTRDGKYAGGIVAKLMSGTVKNCWYAGDISVEKDAGGIVGSMTGGSLINCVYFGTVSSSDGDCGGIAGTTQKGSEIKFCYYSNENSAAVGSGEGKVYLAASFKKVDDEYILSRSVSITDTSTIRLLNALNQWVESISMDDSMRPWKHDTSAGSTARIRGDHPTQIYLGEGKKAQYAAETPMETERKENPYNISYHTTSTMTELYESKTDAKLGGNYSISTGDEMSLLSKFVEEGYDTKGANFYLTTDIYLTTQGTEHMGAGWVPIGTGVSIDYGITSTNRFYGDFDGCGYTVYGLYIVSDFLNFAGLFGRCKGSTIKNLGVCGEILGDDEVGGIVGRLEDGEIINCWSSVTIQASTEIGGIAGHIVDSKVINCTNYGFIVTTLDEGEDSGGIVGSSFGKCEISNCYYLYNGSDAMGNAISDKTSVNDVLYFRYSLKGDHKCTLQQAISIAEIVSDDLLTVLNAWVYAQDSDQYCTWHMATSVQEIPGAAGHYPVLLNSTVIPTPADPDYCGDYTADATISDLYSTRSSGEEGCCYSISNTDDLLAFRKYVNEGYKTEGIIFFLTRDINLQPIYSADTGQSWTPIGTAKKPFKGMFDGQGYTIKYLYIDLAADDDQGLFGHVSGFKSVVKNLGVTGQISSLGVNIAAICADFDFGIIANCWTACEVEGSSNVGGIVGGANMGTIENCVSYGLIIGAKEYGAITGSTVNTEVNNCYYLYASCQQAYPDAAVPNASNVTFFNGSGAMCMLHEYVDVEGTQTKNLSMALKMYVDSHPETNYCYWDIAKSEEYVLMGVGEFPVLISASGTMGEKDYKHTVATFNGGEYYTVPRAANAANAFEGGGTVEIVGNETLEKSEKLVLDDDVSISTGDYSLAVKSKVYVKSMSQLNGTFIVKEGGSIYLWDEAKGDYRLFIYSEKKADMSVDSEFYGTDSLTFCSKPVTDNAAAYNLTFHSGEFMVNSTVDSGNPHKIPADSTLTIAENATLNVLPNARIRTTGDAEIYDYGTVKIGNATLDRNKGTRMKGVLEDVGGIVTLPYIYMYGYTLKGWSSGTALYPAGSTAEITEPTTLKATWSLGESKDPYPGDDYYTDDGEAVYDIPISVIQSAGGTVSPESFLAARGETKAFTVTAQRGYYIKNVLLDGKSVILDENGSFSLVSISEPHTVIALFAPEKNTAYDTWENPFEDIPEDYWCYDSIRYVSSAGLFGGTSSSTFSPTATMTRDMVVVVLWRLSGSPKVPEGFGQSFYDVPAGNYAYDAVRWASAFGIVSGYSDGSFGYRQAVTREQLVTFLFRYAKNYAGEDVSLYDGTNILGYTDVLQISRGMTQPFQWAIGAGIVSGTTPTTLNPKGTATRAQVAAILSRYCNKFVLKEPLF